MTTIRGKMATCSVCYNPVDVRTLRPVLSPRRLRSHEIFQCPHCSYYITIARRSLPRMTEGVVLPVLRH